MPTTGDGPTPGTGTGPMPTTGEAAQAETEEEEGEDNMLEAYLVADSTPVAAATPVADSPTSPDYSPKTPAEMGESME